MTSCGGKKRSVIMQTEYKPANASIVVIIGILYIALLLLFGWQTWEFVNFLFPADQLLMKIFTIISFDVMALLWACTDLFYSFSSQSAKVLVKWAWGVTFVLSLVASILYLVIESMFRFNIVVDNSLINVGYGITIFALTFNIVCMMFFLYMEYQINHQKQDRFIPKQKQSWNTVVAVAQTAEIAAPERRTDPLLSTEKKTGGRVVKQPSQNSTVESL